MEHLSKFQVNVGRSAQAPPLAMSKRRADMGDLYRIDAGGDVPLPPETMIVEARLPSSCAATTKAQSPGLSRCAKSAGAAAFLLALAYVVSKLFAT